MFELTSVLIALTATFLFAGAVNAQEQNTQNQDAQNLYMEYMQIQMDLQNLQQKALEDEKLAVLRDEFTGLIDTELKKLGKDVAKLVEEKNASIDSFEKAQEKGVETEIQAKAQEVQASIEKLQVHEQKVLQLENVSKKQEEFQSAMIAKMMELDPMLQDKIMRLQQIQMQLSQNK